MFGIAKSWSNAGSTLWHSSRGAVRAVAIQLRQLGSIRVQHTACTHPARQWSERWCRGCWGNTRELCRAPLLCWLSLVTAHPGILHTATHAEVLLSKPISKGESASSPEISHVVN